MFARLDLISFNVSSIQYHSRKHKYFGNRKINNETNQETRVCLDELSSFQNCSNEAFPDIFTKRDSHISHTHLLLTLEKPSAQPSEL